MKAAVILSLVATALAAGNCGGDNCARQVTGTRAGLLDITSRKADCTSFQQVTVVPEPTTTTVTVTVDPEEPAKLKRAADGLVVRAATEMPTAVPAYASGCDKPERYASACSCWGITATTSTAPTPTKTVTVTVTTDYCEDL